MIRCWLGMICWSYCSSAGPTLAPIAAACWVSVCTDVEVIWGIVAEARQECASLEGDVSSEVRQVVMCHRS